LKNRLSENQIIKVWQHQLLDRTRLFAEEGEPVEIIYPGRVNDDRGADFRDAVIATSKGIIRGDIEVHVRSSDWQAHRHQQDVIYNRVILHVVMWHNSTKATTLQNGERVPTLALHKHLKTPISQEQNLASSPTTLSIPCLKTAKRLTTDTAAGFLSKAGEKRFLAKAASFRGDLAQIEAGQCLYQGIMGALGYSKNKLPFLELARRLPLKILESIAQDKISDGKFLALQQALLLGTAGLLPSQCQDKHRENRLDTKWIDKLEGLWASSHYTEAMSSNVWHLFKVRPSNSPILRLVAMSHLLLRYRARGILKEIINMVMEVPISRGAYKLESGLLVIDDGYRASHFDFGTGIRIKSPTFLGRERAADITVNVLLPFAFAYSQFTSQPDLGGKALDLYHYYPKLAINSVGKHMIAQLGLNSGLVNSARQQQGLIHIYNTLCTQGKCNCCPLNRI